MLRNYPLRTLFILFVLLPLHIPFHILMGVGNLLAFVGKWVGKGGRWFSKKAANAQQHLNHSTEWFLVPAREYEVQRRVQRREKKRKITEKNDLGDNIIYRDDVTE